MTEGDIYLSNSPLAHYLLVSNPSNRKAGKQCMGCHSRLRLHLQSWLFVSNSDYILEGQYCLKDIVSIFEECIFLFFLALKVNIK